MKFWSSIFPLLLVMVACVDDADFVPVNNNSLSGDYVTLPVIRNELKIYLNGLDSIMVREKLLTKKELEDKIHHFYKANSERETDSESPEYFEVSLNDSEKLKNEDSTFVVEFMDLGIYSKICRLFPSNSFREISNWSCIVLQVGKGVSKSFENEITELIKSVIKQIVSEKSDQIDWDAFKISDSEKKEMLNILIPERVIVLH